MAAIGPSGRQRIARRGVAGGLALAIAVVAAGCASGDLAQPLPDVMIRSRLAGRTVLATENGQRFWLHFQPDGIAIRNAAAAEYGHWRTRDGLCLQWYGEPEQCRPVCQLNVAHLRYGETELSVVGRL